MVLCSGLCSGLTRASMMTVVKSLAIPTKHIFRQSRENVTVTHSGSTNQPLQHRSPTSNRSPKCSLAPHPSSICHSSPTLHSTLDAASLEWFWNYQLAGRAPLPRSKMEVKAVRQCIENGRSYSIRYTPMTVSSRPPACRLACQGRSCHVRDARLVYYNQ